MFCAKINNSLSLVRGKPSRKLSSQALLDELSHVALSHSNQDDKLREVWEVRALCYKTAPVSKPSKIIDRLYETKKLNHDRALEDMRQELEKVNEEVERNFRLESDCVKVMSASIFDRIEVKFKLLMDDQVFAFERSVFTELWRYVMDSINERKNIVSSFNEKILSSEKNRLEKAKIILRNAYQRLQITSFLLPYDLQQLMEHEIMKLNQESLNNFRSYGDLYTHLVQVGQKKQQLFLKRVLFAKLNWNPIKRSRSSITISPSMYITEGALERSQDTQVVIEWPLNELVAAWIKKSPEMVWSTDVFCDLFDGSLKMLVTESEGNISDLLDICKEGVMCTFPEIHEFTEVTDDDLEQLSFYSTKQILELEERIYHPNLIDFQLVEQIPTLDNEQLKIQVICAKVVYEVQVKLREQYLFVLESAITCESHLKRAIRIQKTILSNLYRQISINFKAEIQQEMKLNSLLDILRQESTEEKLRLALENVRKALDDLTVIYSKSLDEENAVICQYSTIIEEQIDILLLEKKKFQTRYPQSWRSSIDLSQEEDSMFLPREVILLDIHMKSLRNWQLGLCESFGLISNTADVCLPGQAEVWMERNRFLAETRYNLKLSLHKPRHDRILTEIYHVRRAELRLHQERFNMHSDGVQDTLVQLRRELEEQKSEKQSVLKDLDRYFEEVKGQAKETTKPYDIGVLLGQLQDHLDMYREKMQNDVSTFQDDCTKRVAWLQESNINFLKSLKFFGEGGNYNVDEARSFSLKIADLNKLIDSSGRVLMTDIKQLEASSFQQGQEVFGEVIETLKNVANDLKFVVTAVGIIKKMQNEIRREVFSLKYKGKLLVQDARKITSTVSNCRGCESSLSSLLDNWNSLFGDIFTRSKYLLQPMMPFMTDLADGESKLQGLDLNSVSRSETTGMKEKSPAVRERRSYIDYRNMLFGVDSSPPSDKSFMSSICCILWQGFSVLQDTAADYYAAMGSNPIQRPDLIQPQYKDFMEDLVVKFKYYHLQCKDVWWQQVQDFVSWILKLRDSANTYAEKLIPDIHARNMMEIKDRSEKFTSELKMELQRDEAGRRTLDERLKPLHGYPGNRTLLKDLNAEVAEAEHGLRERIGSFLSKNKENMQEALQSCLLCTRSLQDSLEGVLRQIFSSDITEVLTQQMEDARGAPQSAASIGTSENLPVLQVVQSSSGKRIDGKDNLMAKNTIEDLAPDTNMILNSKNVPDQHHLSLQCWKLYDPKDKTQHELVRSSVDPLDEQRSLETSWNTLVNIHKPLSLTGAFDSMLQEFQDAFDLLMATIDEQYLSCENASKKWFTTWNINVEKVKKLYTVNYGC